MTFAELIAAFRAMSPEDQSRFLVEVSRKRGRPATAYDVKLAKARELIECVEAKRDELLGDLQAAYPALATPRRKAKTVERQYIAAKTFVEEDSIVSIFNEFASEA